jgi:type IV pilus assembly protein PilQ
MVLVPATPGEGQAPSRREVSVASSPASVPDGSALPGTQVAAASRRAGEVEITGAQLQIQGADAGQLVISADQPIPTYESFFLPEPPRVVVDIPGAVHAIKEPIAVPPDGPVTRIRSSQYKERPVPVVRFVADLRSGLPYRVETAGPQLRVYLGGQLAQQAPSAPALAQPPPAPGQPPASAPAAAPAPGKVTRVDVRVLRGRSRISIGTAGKVAFNITEVSDPPSLVLDISEALIEPRAARAIEVRQATSPVQRVRAAQYQQDGGRTVRVIADLRAPAKYEVAQVGSAIQLDLLAQAPAQAAGPPAPPPAGGPAGPTAPASAPPPAPTAPTAGSPGGEQARISMDFKEADINNLLRIIAEVSGLNVVAGDDVKGKVTVRLVNVEWEQALDLILKINNLAYERDGNVIRVASQATLQREREARAKAQQEEAQARLARARTSVQVEPLQFRIMPVNYAKAADLLLKFTPLKTPGRPDSSIVADDRTNSLMITELPPVISRIETMLKTLDRPTPQVMIEARIVEATKTFSQTLGIQWGGGAAATAKNTSFPNAYTLFGTTQSNATTITPPAPFTGTAVPAGGLGTAAGPVPVLVNFAAGAAASAAPAAIGFTIGSLTQPVVLGAQISAAESEGKTRTLSAPKVMTLDNIEAEIRQGQQVPYTTIDSSGRTVVAFQDAFIRLKVTPHITNDRRISMKVEAEKTDPGTRIDFAGGFAFPLNQQKATTNVLVSNGSTIVIGGLFKTTENYTENRVPFLANIPFLGMLFKSKSIGPDDRNELLIFLTPTISEDPKPS